MAAWMSVALRLSSSSGKAGWSSTSASRSSPRSRSFFSTARLTVAVSRPASVSRLPPTNSMARSSSGAVRLAVPRVSRSAVRFASPPASGGSKAEPARIDTRTTTIGIAGRSATSSRMPFGKTSRCASGAAVAPETRTPTRRREETGRRRLKTDMRTPSIECLAKLEDGKRKDDGPEDQERNQVGPQVAEAHALEHDAADDSKEVRYRDDRGQVLRAPGHALDGEEEAREVDGGQKREEGHLHRLGHRPRGRGEKDANA